jgi:adhesin/invasin
MQISSLHNARKLAAVLGFAALAAACGSDKVNSAPLAATAVTADAASNNQSATAGSTLASNVVVHVTDQNGNALSGAMVTWTVVNHAGSTSAATSTTDATGTASVKWTLDTIARVDSMSASIQSGASVTVTATGTAGSAANAQKVSGDSQTDVSGTTSAAFVMKVTDRYGNAVSGVIVTWAATGGGALSSSTSTTDASGKTSVTLTLGSTPGPYVITATAGLLAVVTFNLTGT